MFGPNLIKALNAFQPPRSKFTKQQVDNMSLEEILDLLKCNSEHVNMKHKESSQNCSLIRQTNSEAFKFLSHKERQRFYLKKAILQQIQRINLSVLSIAYHQVSNQLNSF